MAFIALLSRLVIPQVFQNESKLFRVQLREANTLLNHARRLAVVKGQEVQVLFTPQAILQDMYTTQTGSKQTAVTDSSQYIWKSRGASVQMAQSVAKDNYYHVTFFPEGSSIGGVLTFTQGKRKANIEINALTGKIKTFFDEKL